MRVLALDVGDKTIGVALSDELKITARGLFTLERISNKKDTSKIIELIDEHKCSTLVIGLPLNLDNSDSVQTQKVRDFETLLKNKLTSTGHKNIEVVLYDERFSTKIAEKVLIEADVSRAKRKEVIDMQAAVVILQGYLEALR